MTTIYKIVSSETTEGSNSYDTAIEQSIPIKNKCSCCSNHSLWKLILVILSFIPIHTLTIVCLVYVDYRRPTTERLPDVIFQLVPYIHAEFIINILMYIQIGCAVIMALCDKRRIIILRRSLAVYAILSILRNFTMTVTGLPDPSLVCPPPPKASEMTFKAIVKRLAAGFSCGDMIFSGHSICLFLPALLVGKYFSSKIAVLFWINAFVNVFLLVAARIHYTVDVLLSLFFAVPIFLLYNIISENPTIASSIPRILQAYFNFMEWEDSEIPTHEYSGSIDNVNVQDNDIALETV